MQPEKEKQGSLEKVESTPIEKTRHLVSVEHYEGLLPHPKLMREWDDLIPGSAKSIFTRFENQSDHRIEIEKSVVRAQNFKLYVGPIFALIISLVAIGAGLWIALVVQPYAGSFLSLAGLATLIAPFLVGERTRSNNDNSDE